MPNFNAPEFRNCGNLGILDMSRFRKESVMCRQPLRFNGKTYMCNDDSIRKLYDLQLPG